MRSSLSVGAAIVRHSIRTVFGGISRNAIGTTIFVMRAGDSGVVNAPLIAAGAFVRFGSSRSEEHTSELQSLMRISYAVFCLKKKKYSGQDLQTYKHSFPQCFVPEIDHIITS